jgi:hypothetical protein
MNNILQRMHVTLVNCYQASISSPSRDIAKAVSVAPPELLKCGIEDLRKWIMHPLLTPRVG